MSVIVHLRLSATSFELGRILEMETDTSIVLEDLVPLGENAVPFFTVHDATKDDFEATVRAHSSVETITEVNTHDDQTLYALDWAVSEDLFFQGIREMEGHLLNGTGTTDTWEFELRFPTHTALGEFKDHCANADLSVEVIRIYNPTRPDSGPWYGLTPRQRDTLTQAVQEGYYSIPCGISTQELAEALQISDQAVTERLRRAIITLVENTLIIELDAHQQDELEQESS